MKLAIISHTEHYKKPDGTIVGWSPTVNEINHLLAVFEEVYHVAMLHQEEAPPSAKAYTNERIHFVPIQPSGGRTFFSKLGSIYKAPHVIKTVSKVLQKVDCFQLRTPTGIGVYLIPYLTYFTKKKGWYKYAGNWGQQDPPLGYRLQRFMLKHQKRKVTINGSWEDQPEQCYTFENPCLTVHDVDLGERVITDKANFNKMSFCYVGRLEKEKGVERILKAFNRLTKMQKQKLGKVHLVGDGDDRAYFEDLGSSSDVDFVFHGFQPREKVFEIYKETHVFLMPTTASEGFPKAIAEAMNFGCIPVVSNISSIGQYIENNINGILINDVTVENVVEQIVKVLSFTNHDYHKFVADRKQVVDKFTFEHYNRRILNDIIK